jgi:hypothetical protein
MKSLALAFCTVVLASAAYAGAEEDRVLSFFEVACLGNLSDLTQTIVLAESAGLREIKGSELPAVLNGKPGRAWISPSGQQPRLFLKLGTEGVCAVTAPYANRTEIKQIFKKFIKNRFIKTEPFGSEVQDIFAVSYPSPTGATDIHSIVMIQFSQLETVDGISVTAITENAALKAGISRQTYP